jgi:hypothetical protein
MQNFTLSVLQAHVHYEHDTLAFGSTKKYYQMEKLEIFSAPQFEVLDLQNFHFALFSVTSIHWKMTISKKFEVEK